MKNQPKTLVKSVSVVRNGKKTESVAVKTVCMDKADKTRAKAKPSANKKPTAPKKPSSAVKKPASHKSTPRKAR